LGEGPGVRAFAALLLFPFSFFTTYNQQTTMTTHILTPNTQAILLLCGSLGQRRNVEPKPLTQSEYHKFALWLHGHKMQPCDLLAEEGLLRLSELDDNPIEPRRLFALLNRGTALALAVEGWTNQGIWIISRSDEAYPKRLKARLKQAAPAILYGVGNQTLLYGGGLVIVGSRDVDEVGLAFTRIVAQRCVQEGIPVISGGARGVDSEAMLSALQEGGQVVGILAHALARTARSKKYRAALHTGNLVLISACDPKAGFHVGNAMTRNKYLYALGDWGLAISAALKTGGTWAGATDNLKRQWIPLFVHSGPHMREGNKGLIERGGIPLDEAVLEEEASLRDWLADQVPRTEPPVPRVQQLSLLDWRQEEA